MKTRLLSKVSEGTALGYISRIQMKGSGQWTYTHSKANYKIPNSPYIDKMLSMNSLICHKCMQKINIGQQYTYRSMKRRVTKYYHSSCYETMFQ